MLLVNDVYQYFDQRYRVLWRANQSVYWINIDSDDALPELISYEKLVGYLSDGHMSCADDPFQAFLLNPTKRSKWAQDIQQKSWAMIEKFVSQEPAIFDKKQRGEMVRAMISEHGATKAHVYRKLRAYWQRGKSPQALFPDTSTKGAPKKPKAISDKKRGRPRANAVGTGVNITPDIEQVFRVAIKAYYLTTSQNPVRYAYRKALIALGFDVTKKHELNLAEAPTYRQFYYFLKKETTEVDRAKKRFSDITYDKDLRPVLGTSTTDAMGPGSLYQIDATIGDIYLVDEETRTRIVGRPVIYIVVDVFSRLITGVSVGLEGPSWVGAMFALANTLFDKVKYCARYKIDIASEDWPVLGKPEAILADRGELLGKTIEILSESLFIDIQNTPSFRADWKAIVERYFKTIQANFKPYVEGYVVDTTVKKRGGHDYRLDAELTLSDVTRIILNCVIIYNTTHDMTYYDVSKDMPPELPLNPLAIWNWGIQHRTGRLRATNEELAAVNLMPHKEVSVTKYGVYLFNCYYSSAHAIKEGWFDRIGSNMPKITVAYDPHNTNTIYFRPEGRYDSFIPFELTERSRAYRDLTFWEVWQLQKQRSKTHATSQLKKLEGELKRDHVVEEIVKEARTKKPDQSHLPKSLRARGIRENRTAEIAKNRSENTGVMPAKPVLKKPPKNNVLYLTGQKPTDYSPPDLLDEIYGDDDD